MTDSARITKKLSANDIGKNGSHQAGMHIPKDPSILEFFPALKATEKNPRVSLTLSEPDAITRWTFNFIYYNNKFFGGTRNEYRLTGMTKFLAARNANVGDVVVLSKGHGNKLVIEVIRNDQFATEHDEILVLSGGWKVIKI